MNQLQRCGRWPARWWAAGQAGGQGGTRPPFGRGRAIAAQWPAFLQAKPKKPAFHAYSLQPRRVAARISTRSGITWLQHDNTAPLKLMTAAEMLQAQADIQTDARARLQEIRDEIALLEAEMADLEEVIDG